MDFVVGCPLVQTHGLISGSCSSGRRFASGFLQTPPRGDALALGYGWCHQPPGRTSTFQVSAHAGRTTELARLLPRQGYNKEIVAIARKLLVAVWHILTKQTADRFALPEQVAKKFMNYACRLGRENRPQGQPVADYVPEQLDRLQVGKDLAVGHTSTRRIMKLPPSRLNDSGCQPRPGIEASSPTGRLATALHLNSFSPLSVAWICPAGAGCTHPIAAHTPTN